MGFQTFTHPWSSWHYLPNAKANWRRGDCLTVTKQQRASYLIGQGGWNSTLFGPGRDDLSHVLVKYFIVFLSYRGRISYFTHPPETHTLPTHVSAEIVTEMGKAFDWDELEKGNQEVLAGRQWHRHCILTSLQRKKNALQNDYILLFGCIINLGLCFRIIHGPNGILHGNGWDDTRLSGWGRVWLDDGGGLCWRPRTKRWNWIYGWWPRHRGRVAGVFERLKVFTLAKILFSSYLCPESNPSFPAIFFSKTVWTNDGGDEIC